jgi:hypothetical protein
VIHTYYTVELAPAIAALVGIGAGVLWQRREQPAARAGMALIVAVTAAWAVVMLQRTPSWETWLTPLVIVTAVAAICGLAAPPQLRRSVARATAICAIVACLAAPAAYTAETLSTAHTGSVPSAGPTVNGTSGGFGGGGAPSRATSGTRSGATLESRSGATRGASSGETRAFSGGAGATARGGAAGGAQTSSALVKALESDASKYRWVAATSGSQSAATLELSTGGDAVMAIGGFSGEGGNITLAQFEKYVKAGDIHYYIASSGGMGGAGGAPGSSSGSSSATGSTGSGTISQLFGDSSSASKSSSGSVPSGAPGGSTGERPSGSTGGAPTGTGAPGGTTGARVGGASGAPGGRSTTQSITAWVKAHYKAVTIGGQTLYDLTSPVS